MGIIEKIITFWLSEGNESTKVSRFEKATFSLKFKDIIIGKLWLEYGICHFKYNNSYESNADFSTLIDFSNKQKRYKSEELWPFFVHRIPALKQPVIQEILKIEHIDPTDEVSLLRRFGE